MRADLYLVEKGYYESRSRAQEAIKTGRVKVDGRILKKASERLAEGARIEAEQAHPWVSRGGLKLVHALDVFNIEVKGRHCLDVGASTGGFTHVLIETGAAHVTAVDVGRDQLHPSLQDHPQITSLEAQDARSLTEDMFTRPPELIVCDASFISLSKVLPVPLSLAAKTAELVTLVKPQFEVGKDGLGKGGIVKSETLALQSLSDVCGWIETEGWSVKATTASPIRGGSGNQEYLLHAIKN